MKDVSGHEVTISDLLSQELTMADVNEKFEPLKVERLEGVKNEEGKPTEKAFGEYCIALFRAYIHYHRLLIVLEKQGDDPDHLGINGLLDYELYVWQDDGINNFRYYRIDDPEIEKKFLKDCQGTDPFGVAMRRIHYKMVQRLEAISEQYDVNQILALAFICNIITVELKKFEEADMEAASVTAASVLLVDKFPMGKVYQIINDTPGLTLLGDGPNSTLS